MAKLVTVVRTYFQSGNYRNSTIEIDIPDEAAELIKKSWDERGVYNCVTAKFLSSNQAGICLMYKGGKEIAGIQGMPQEKTQEEEVFVQHFKDEEEEDDE